ncbi:MAG: RNB domain-containing ribonuclease [Proteobacteria bacterium]|nr:RNB domain-containing ribonuclease [Pseudomonadota bacterium]MBU1710219.1 RNB domain-containing ribonuclease [Pseudomonadota bacterium]
MSLAGKIIEYIEHGKMICAIVLKDSSNKLQLLNKNGRDVSLSAARVVYHSDKAYSLNMTRDEMIRQLQEIAQKRLEMMAKVDLEEIWSLAVEEKNDAFDPRFLTELSFGERASDDHVAAFLRCIFIDKLFFKFREGMIIVHSREIVEQLQLKADKEKQQDALLDSGARMLRGLFEGKANDQESWPEKERCLDLLKDFYLFGNEAKESDLARELLKRAGLNNPHDVYYLLVNAGIWEANENIPLLRYEIPCEFSDEALQSIADCVVRQDQLLAEASRKDLRHLNLFTIDGAETRDFDDALHIEQKADNFLVGIHIADVAHFIKPGSPLFEEALKRITSLYFPESRVPMLPGAISEDLCSLKRGESRAAMSFMVLLSKEGEMLDFDIISSIVSVKRQLSYPEADGLMDTDPALKSLSLLANKLRQRRLAAGALLLPIPDVVISVNEDEVDIRLAEVDTPSRSLIAEFMVLANSIGAQFVSDRQVHGLFRAQKEPRQRLIQGYEKDLYTIYRQRKYLSPAKMLTTPEPHSCVGVMQYTTVTSPIRRFLDLVMQHQISALLQGKGELFPDNDLKDFSRAIQATQTKVNLVRQLRHRYWLYKYYEKFVGSRVDAMVIDSGPRRVQVLLLDTLLEGSLPANQGVHPDFRDILSVRIAKVSALDDDLRLEW